MEQLIVEMIIEDMKAKLDPSQFGNQHNIGIQHYLIRLIHRVVTSLDKTTKDQVNAVICLFIDFRQAYSRQSHTIGVNSLIKNGVRPALIPILINYFENRQMRVKWHGKLSQPRDLPGSGAMGSSIGNWEFLSQTNDSADCVPLQDRYKFIDDLSVLEIINLLNIGISSFNTKQQVPNDLPIHGQVIPNDQLKSQQYLTDINDWAKDKQMQVSSKKTKAMIFNFSKKFQFFTRLQLEDMNIEIVDHMKILGTTITNDLSWDKNCDIMIKKVNARMELIRKADSFGASDKELVHM